MLTIRDGIWPAFTPDLISIALVTATQAKGSVLIHQWMFESRLFFVDNLIDMGAKIILCDPHRATVIGLNRHYPLRGISMTSPDIRAGVSLLIAAMSVTSIACTCVVDKAPSCVLVKPATWSEVKAVTSPAESDFTWPVVKAATWAVVIPAT